MVTIAGGGVVLVPGEARTIDLGGFGVTVLADEDVTSGGFALIETAERMRHTFQSAEAGSRKLNLYTPAGMVDYFDALATGTAEGLDDAGLDAIAERYQMEVVGPVPEGYLLRTRIP
jgi:hypothetical protein